MRDESYRHFSIHCIPFGCIAPVIRRFHGRIHRLMQQIRYPIFSLCDFQRTGAHNRSFLRDDCVYSSGDYYPVTT